MNGSAFGEERDVSGAIPKSTCFASSGIGSVTTHRGLSLVASRASKWPDVPSGMIDLFRHDGDLEAFFGD